MKLSFIPVHSRIFAATIFHLAFFLMVAALSCAPSWAADKTELGLHMEPLFFWATPGYGRGLECDVLFKYDGGRDQDDLFNAGTAYCEIKYTLWLQGPAGTMVTLFAQRGFGKDRGFLVIKKTDDKMVWILDLNKFPPDKWTSTPPEDKYGGFETYYRYGPVFDQRVSSLKWGQWWTGDTPGIFHRKDAENGK